MFRKIQEYPVVYFNWGSSWVDTFIWRQEGPDALVRMRVRGTANGKLWGTTMAVNNPHRLLEELVRLESLRVSNTSSSNRVYSRFGVRGEAEITPMDRNGPMGEPISILLRDVGRGGLGFVSSRSLEACSTWRVGLLQNGYVFATHGIIIRHCKMIRPDLYLVGAQFCIETGLLCLLGVHPAEIEDGDRPTSDHAQYIPPAEVA